MPEISEAANTQDQPLRAQAERYDPRPDLRDAPENPPVDEDDLERGREKLERVIAK